MAKSKREMKNFLHADGLVYLLAQAGLSQKEMADYCGVSASTISTWKNARHRAPKQCVEALGGLLVHNEISKREEAING